MPVTSSNTWFGYWDWGNINNMHAVRFRLVSFAFRASLSFSDNVTHPLFHVSYRASSSSSDLRRRKAKITATRVWKHKLKHSLFFTGQNISSERALLGRNLVRQIRYGLIYSWLCSSDKLLGVWHDSRWHWSRAESLQACIFKVILEGRLA